MGEQMWRFPDNNYTNENGLDTSDMEMFKKDPVSSLAREICQNSIDAAYNDFENEEKRKENPSLPKFKEEKSF